MIVCLLNLLGSCYFSDFVVLCLDFFHSAYFYYGIYRGFDSRSIYRKVMTNHRKFVFLFCTNETPSCFLWESRFYLKIWISLDQALHLENMFELCMLACVLAIFIFWFPFAYLCLFKIHFDWQESYLNQFLILNHHIQALLVQYQKLWNMPEQLWSIQ